MYIVICFRNKKHERSGNLVCYFSCTVALTHVRLLAFFLDPEWFTNLEPSHGVIKALQEAAKSPDVVVVGK